MEHLWSTLLAVHGKASITQWESCVLKSICLVDIRLLGEQPGSAFIWSCIKPMLVERQAGH